VAFVTQGGVAFVDRRLSALPRCTLVAAGVLSRGKKGGDGARGARARRGAPVRVLTKICIARARRAQQAL